MITSGMTVTMILVAGFSSSQSALAMDDINAMVIKPDPRVTTPNNCTCTSICRCGLQHSDCDPGNPISFYPESSTYLGEVLDWCNTAENCGQYSVTRGGYWDYCKFKSTSEPDWVAKSWKEKTDITMKRVYDFGPSLGRPTQFDKLLGKSVITTMVSRWDTLPAGRFKSHHSSGAICKFTLDIKNSPYSGTLKDGNRTGIIRIGADLDGGSISNTSGPGVSAALKFFRSGIPSGNTVVQRLPFASLTSTYDFFDPEVNIMYNHRNGITRYMIIQDKVNFKNKQGSSIAAATGLSDLARYDQDGNEEKQINFPYKISLKPTGEVRFREEPSNNLDLLQQFVDKIPAGTELYSFIAFENPNDMNGTELGKLVVIDGCYPSRYGDEKLFFKHQRIEEDIELMPEWKNDYMWIEYE